VSYVSYESGELYRRKKLQMDKKKFADDMATAKKALRDLGPHPTSIAGKIKAKYGSPEAKAMYGPNHHKGQDFLGPTAKARPKAKMPLKPKAQGTPIKGQGKGQGQGKGHKNVLMKGAKGDSSSKDVLMEAPKTPPSERSSSSSSSSKDCKKEAAAKGLATAPWKRGRNCIQVLFA